MKSIPSRLKHVVDRRLPALSKNYRRLRDHLRFRSQKPYQTELGFQLYGDADLEVSRTGAGEVEVFLRHAKRADAVIDVGANVGFFSCLAARERLPVLAFEPDANNLRSLYRNLELNRFTDIEVYPLALSERPALLPLFGGGQGATLLPGWGGIQSAYERLTPVNTLDNIVYTRFREARLFIKVDVEGNEYRTLQGSKLLLAKDPAPVWMVEHGLKENFAYSCNPHFKDVFELFWTHRYEAFTVGPDQKLVRPEDVNRWVANQAKDFGGIDYLFVRRDA